MSELTNIDGQPDGDVARMIAVRYLPTRVFNALKESGISFEISFPNGDIEKIGIEASDFRANLKTKAALYAVASLNEMRIAEAYCRGDIDIDGDLVRVFDLRNIFVDLSPLTSIWRFLEPIIFGQINTNKRAISSHYDVDASFFMSFLDRKVPSYTQGVYCDNGETLAAATIRKFEYCFERLRLKPGDHILDIGPGWGAWLEYASSRGVKCTGITISEEVAQYLRQKSDRGGYDWNIVFSDFLEYKSEVKFNAVVIMGVIEHLPQYELVVEKFQALIIPGGRIFLDGSADVKKHNVAKFLVKYIYPGNHSYMLLHDFLRALDRTPLRLVELYNDRQSYYLTALQWARNLDDNKNFVENSFGVDVYRRFRLYLWGTVHQFKSGNLDCYRMIIESPASK